MRKLALDVGDVRIGLATSDIMGIIASGYETYTRKSLAQDYAYIADFCKKNTVDTLVIGLPVNMDGTEGPRVEVTREFKVKSPVKYSFKDFGILDKVSTK